MAEEKPSSVSKVTCKLQHKHNINLKVISCLPGGEIHFTNNFLTAIVHDESINLQTEILKSCYTHTI